MYEAHFRCPVKFKSNQNSLVFSNADMELPFVTYNPDLLAIVAPQLEVELAQQLAQKTFTEQAKGILKQLLAGQRPGIQDLARELHVSTRTLQPLTWAAPWKSSPETSGPVSLAAGL